MSNEKFEKHTIEYQHEGSTWDIEIVATSETDAWQRLHRAAHGNYLGVWKEAPAQLSFFVKAGCFLGNLCRSGRD